jgi:hypothetical protein
MEIIITETGPGPCQVVRVGRLFIESTRLIPNGPVSHSWVYVEDVAEGKFVGIRGTVLGSHDDLKMWKLPRILSLIKEVISSARRLNPAA